MRVADVCLDPDSVLLLAALARGLVEWAADEWAADKPARPVRTALLRAASWRAARYGLSGELLDPETFTPGPAAAVLRQLLDLVRPSLAGYGDDTYVEELVEQVLVNGTGSERQRGAVAGSGRLEDAVRLAVGQMTP
jgi:carboxylate-amine ligase